MYKLELVQVVAQVGEGLLQALPLLGVLANLIGFRVGFLINGIARHDLMNKTKG